MIVNLRLLASGSAVGASPAPPLLAEMPDLDVGRAGTRFKDQWAKRGQLDREMFDDCMRMQREGRDEAVGLVEKYDMVAYELDRQIDAFLNVAHEVKAVRFGADEVTFCRAEWRSDDEPRWDMVEYCLNN